MYLSTLAIAQAHALPSQSRNRVQFTRLGHRLSKLPEQPDKPFPCKRKWPRIVLQIPKVRTSLACLALWSTQRRTRQEPSREQLSADWAAAAAAYESEQVRKATGTEQPSGFSRSPNGGCPPDIHELQFPCWPGLMGTVFSPWLMDSEVYCLRSQRCLSTQMAGSHQLSPSFP